MYLILNEMYMPQYFHKYIGQELISEILFTELLP